MSKRIIYGLTKRDKVVYVGISSNIERRKKEHVRQGTKYFDSIIVLETLDENRNGRIAENYWIDRLDTINNGYNKEFSSISTVHKPIKSKKPKNVLRVTPSRRREIIESIVSNDTDITIKDIIKKLEKNNVFVGKTTVKSDISKLGLFRLNKTRKRDK